MTCSETRFRITGEGGGFLYMNGFSSGHWGLGLDLGLEMTVAWSFGFLEVWL